jgi:hypothetical protein
MTVHYHDYFSFSFIVIKLQKAAALSRRGIWSKIEFLAVNRLFVLIARFATFEEKSHDNARQLYDIRANAEDKRLLALCIPKVNCFTLNRSLV